MQTTDHIHKPFRCDAARCPGRCGRAGGRRAGRGRRETGSCLRGGFVTESCAQPVTTGVRSHIAAHQRIAPSASCDGEVHSNSFLSLGFRLLPGNQCSSKLPSARGRVTSPTLPSPRVEQGSGPNSGAEVHC